MGAAVALPDRYAQEFDRAVLERVDRAALEEDLVGLDGPLRDRGVDVLPALHRQLYRHQVQVGPRDFVAGRLPFIRVALQQLGIGMPAPLDYLGASGEVLGRRVWRSTLGAVLSKLDRGEQLFIKPYGRTKRFTGRVVGDRADLIALPARSPSTPLWCSEVLELRSEHRVFVCRGEIVGIRHYDGDATITPPAHGVRAILDELAASLPAGCAIDVGVTADGAVVLVEANDGYALGRYGLDSDPYLRVLEARWTELVPPT